jgi:cytochrome P450
MEYIAFEYLLSGLGSNDADHARIRRSISHALSKSALYEQEPLQKPFFDTLIKKLQSKIDGPTKGKVDLVHWMTFTTFDLVGDLTFGESFDALETEQYNFWIANIFTAFKMATAFAALGQYPLFTAPIFFLVSRFPALERAKQKHERYSLEKAERRLAAITDRNDLMRSESCTASRLPSNTTIQLYSEA